MPDFTNIVTVDLTEATGYNVEAHRAVHQWDSGVILQLTGATFPQGTTCQFDTKTTTFNQELTDGACEIPNALLGYDMIGDIKAHVKIDDDNYGIVVYDIHIPVIRRPKPDSYIYTDNSSSSNGWIKSRYGYRVNEDQTILSRTELSINDNQTVLDGTSLSLNNQQTVLDGTHLSLASGLFYADATHLQLNSGRVTIGPTQLLVDSRVFGSVNLANRNYIRKCTLTGDGVKGSPNIYRLAYVKPIKVNPSTTYHAKLTPSSGSTIHFFVLKELSLYGYMPANESDVIFDGGGTSPTSAPTEITFTTKSTTYYVKFVFRHTVNNQECYEDEISAIQLEEASTFSSYINHSLSTEELTDRRFVQDWESKNIFDMSLLEQGGLYAENGNEQPLTMRVRSSFVPVEPSTLYTLCTYDALNNSAYIRPRMVCLYNSSKSWISTLQTDMTSTRMTIKTTEGTSYVRICLQKSDSGNFTPSDVPYVQLERGNYVSPYVPYSMTVPELTDRIFSNNRNLELPQSITLFSYSAGTGQNAAKPTFTRKPVTSWTTLDSLVTAIFTYRGSSNGSVPLISFDNGNIAIPQGWYFYNATVCGASEGTKECYLTLYPRSVSLHDSYHIRINESSGATLGFRYTQCERHIRRDGTPEAQWGPNTAVRYAVGPGGMVVGTVRATNSTGITLTNTLICRNLPSPAWGELYFSLVGMLAPSIRIVTDSSTNTGLMYLNNGSVANNSTVYGSFAYISNDPKLYYEVNS